jgi:hypothetical protein
MPLISYVKTVMNKWLLISESHGDSNRYTPYRENPDQHDAYAFHTSPHTPGVCFLWAVPAHCNFSRVVDTFGQITLLPRKRAPDIIHSTPAN